MKNFKLVALFSALFIIVILISILLPYHFFGKTKRKISVKMSDTPSIKVTSRKNIKKNGPVDEKLVVLDQSSSSISNGIVYFKSGKQRLKLLETIKVENKNYIYYPQVEHADFETKNRKLLGYLQTNKKGVIGVFDEKKGSVKLFLNPTIHAIYVDNRVSIKYKLAK